MMLKSDVSSGDETSYEERRIPGLLSRSGRRTVLFDFLGFGASDKPGQGYCVIPSAWLKSCC
jgi:pimeloyl-ACP methyl ester carboxylesterase